MNRQSIETNNGNVIGIVNGWSFNKVLLLILLVVFLFVVGLKSLTEKNEYNLNKPNKFIEKHCPGKIDCPKRVSAVEDFVTREKGLQKVNLSNSNYDRAYLEYIDAPEARIRNSTFNHANLKGANFYKGNIEKTKFIEADFTCVHKPQREFKRSEFGAAYIEHVDFTGSNFQCKEVGKEKTSFYIADIKNSIFNKALLQGVNFVKLNSQNLSFIDAKLTNANMNSAKLIDANFTKADVGKANLWAADIEGAIFYNVKNLTNRQIKSACNWDKAFYKKDKKANQDFIKKLKANNPYYKKYNC